MRLLRRNWLAVSAVLHDHESDERNRAMAIDLRALNRTGLSFGCLGLAIILSWTFLATFSARNSFGQLSDDAVLVTVNGEKITEADLRSFLLSRRIPEDKWPDVRKKMLEELVDRTLVREFLKDNKVVANEVQLERQLALSRKVAEATGEKLTDVLSRLGLTEKTLKDELAFPLAWRAYAFRVITDAQIAERFEAKPTHYDGTKVSALQIFLKVPENATAAEIAARKVELNGYRLQIKNGKMSFDEAAKKYSESPSGKKGGDIGSFRYEGRMPSAITEVTFGLKAGEISEPFESPFGVHLVKVTKFTPGQFSLEDARPSIFDDLSDEIYQQTVSRLRKSSTIQ